MTMPEAAVDEDGGAVLLQHDVRMARQARVTKAVAESAGMKVTAHDELGLRVTRPNGSHILMPLLWRQAVGHSRVFSNIAKIVQAGGSTK